MVTPRLVTCSAADWGVVTTKAPKKTISTLSEAIMSKILPFMELVWLNNRDEMHIRYQIVKLIINHLIFGWVPDVQNFSKINY